MKFRCLLLVLTFFVPLHFVAAQANFLPWQRDSITKDVQRYFTKDIKGLTWEIKNDSLYIRVLGKDRDTIAYVLGFGTAPPHFSTYERVTYSCSKCFDAYIETDISNRQKKWRKTKTKDFYVSKFNERFTMQIVRPTANDPHLHIMYTWHPYGMEGWTRKNYRVLRKGIRTHS